MIVVEIDVRCFLRSNYPSCTYIPLGRDFRPVNLIASLFAIPIFMGAKLTHR